AIAPFATYLITNYDWRTAYIVLGIIAGVLTMAASLLIRKQPADMGLLPDGVKSYRDLPEERINKESVETNLSLYQALKSGSFWIILIIFILWGIALHIVLTHIVPHATDIGISPIEASGILSLIGGINIIGRLTLGWIADRIGRKRTAIACAVIEAFSVLLLLWSHDLWQFYIFAVIFGFVYGGFVPSLFSLTGDIFGLRNLGVILGMLDIGWGTGSAIGPTLGGFIFDTTDSYFTAFIVVVLALLGIAVQVSFLPGQKKDR
ncbi:MFS transporter, partial [Chloroflexota bacterium]